MSFSRIYFGIIVILLIIIRHGNGQNIHGGPVVSLVNYEFQATVLIVIRNKITKFCGGTILSKSHVLTTATCFTKIPNDYYDIQVRVGSVNILAGGDVYNVSKVERHPAFDTYLTKNNLAIIFITSGIQFVERTEIQIDQLNYYLKKVNAVKLGHQFVIGGEPVTISGYSIKSMETPFYNLQNIYTHTMSFFLCVDYFYKTAMSIEVSQDEVLCVKNVKTTDFCDILEGSPVILESKLVGILTGETCHDEHQPLTFTRIENNLLWLHSNVDKTRFHDTGSQCFSE